MKANKTKPRRKVRRLFASNPFILGFSLVLSFGIWLGITVGVAPEEERVLPRVHVTFEQTAAIAELNLEAFVPQESLFVDVTVKGKRYILNEITPEQIIVRAQTVMVGSAGLKSLRLTAVNASAKDFQIVRLSQQEVSVLFDELREQDFQLETVLLDASGKPLKNKDSAAPKGYKVDHELLSNSSVTLSGPASEISRVKTVTATAQLTGKLTDTRAFPVTIAPQTGDSVPLQFVTINTADEVTMTLPVYKSVSLPVTVEWLNVPPAYAEKPLKITCSPQKARFGISESQLEEVKSVTVGMIDFSKLRAGRMTEFKFPAAEVRQYKLLSDEEFFKVSVDTTGKVSDVFAVPHSNIQMLEAPEGITVQAAPGSLDAVTVAGSAASLKALESGDIYAEADLTGVRAQNGEVAVPARVFVRGYDDCWIIGEYVISLVLKMN